MKRYLYFFLPVWIILLLIGLRSLVSNIKPLMQSEQIILAAHETHWLQAFGSVRLERRIVNQEINGFHFQRSEDGLMAGTLTLKARGDTITIAEHVREADKEWLASVGNALLRR